MRAWDRLHPRLTHRAAWLDHEGPLPVIEGTLIRLQVEYLPGDRDAQPMWLWWSGTFADPRDVDRTGQAYLRRFDLEHTFRLFKQTLGWTRPKLRDPQAADRWTWIMIAAHTQLRLARPGSGEGFGTSARHRRYQPQHRNPLALAPDGLGDRRTTTTPTDTRWARPSNAKPRWAAHPAESPRPEVKEQAQCLSRYSNHRLSIGSTLAG
ncbi:hypothetical protein SAMN06264365_11882 [Actinoplanes regularis]|uniref:Transposase DDE domain-containing protein n=1 Tax=Actinoplanes regularis TaxID=52697 RepID=A0A239FIE2_9ACTN|nr:hypothetical protein Are01nite_60810 [Actinoplanes regularis]SNS56298.1 hypothetical protein SAMN06264365_11882 [Actinoplanes regularis]